MTLFWTAASEEVVFQGFEESRQPFQEVNYGGVTMLVSPMDNGLGRVERLISPNPQDYLRSEWQPGAFVPLMKRMTDVKHVEDE